MPRLTLVWSRNGSARDSESGAVVHVGETVEVPVDVADRLRSTWVLGDEWTAEDSAEENDQPAASVVAVIEPAVDPQEVSS